MVQSLAHGGETSNKDVNHDMTLDHLLARLVNSLAQLVYHLLALLVDSLAQLMI